MSFENDAARPDAPQRASVVIDAQLIQLAQSRGHDPDDVREEIERFANQVAQDGPKGPDAGRRVLAVLVTWLVTSALVLIGLLIALWDENAASVKSATRILLLVIIAGCLGGTISALGFLLSEYESRGAVYLRNVPSLTFVPLVSAGLALVFYYVIRGGLLTAPGGGDTELEVINVYGVVGISALVGMFFSGALSKLKAVSEAIFGDDGGQRSARKT
jgi:Na+/phosphate symporter